MKTPVIVRLEDKTKNFIKLSDSLALVIKTSIELTLAEVGDDYFVDALCNRNEKSQLLAA